MNRRSASFIFVVLVLISVSGAGCSNDASIQGVHANIVAGSPTLVSSDDVVATWYENALVYIQSDRPPLGVGHCSGTLIADRMIATAAHCVVENYEGWWLEGEEFVLVDPADLHAAVRPADGTSCDLETEEIIVDSRLWPEPDRGIINYDYALLILSESTVAGCDQVLPVPLGELEWEDIGATFAVGGFGFLDEQWTMLGERRWAHLELSVLTHVNHIFNETGEGAIVPGDSGGGVWRIAEGAAPQLVAIVSSVVPPRMSATSIVTMATKLHEARDSVALCPETSACRGSRLVSCDQGEFAVEDCGNTPGGTCQVEAGGARCIAPEPEPPVETEVAPDGGAMETGMREDSATPCMSAGGCSATKEDPGWSLVALFFVALASYRHGRRGRRRARR